MWLEAPLNQSIQACLIQNLVTCGFLDLDRLNLPSLLTDIQNENTAAGPMLAARLGRMFRSVLLRDVASN